MCLLSFVIARIISLAVRINTIVMLHVCITKTPFIIFTTITSIIINIIVIISMLNFFYYCK